MKGSPIAYPHSLAYPRYRRGPSLKGSNGATASTAAAGASRVDRRVLSLLATLSRTLTAGNSPVQGAINKLMFGVAEDAVCALLGQGREKRWVLRRAGRDYGMYRFEGSRSTPAGNRTGIMDGCSSALVVVHTMRVLQRRVQRKVWHLVLAWGRIRQFPNPPQGRQISRSLPLIQCSAVQFASDGRPWAFQFCGRISSWHRRSSQACR